MEKYEIAFKIVIQKYKRFIYLPKNVRAQSQKLAPNISKLDYLKRNYTCKECENELNLKEYLAK